MQNSYFYVIYDLYDDVKFLCNNDIEFISLTKLRIKDTNYKFKKNYRYGKKYISVVIDDKFYKVYRYLKDEI